MPDYALESRLGALHGGRVAGIDEAGRGPWAGPVVAAAVVLDRDALPPALLARLDDSKALKPAEREAIHDALEAEAELGKVWIGRGQAEVEEIDRLNILAATMAAMARALAALTPAPAAALVDGNRLPALACPAEAVVKGDGRSLSIAAASIVAKVTRDREMAALARRFPGYGWERNRGYGTAEHQAALASLGVTPAHRRTFRPIRELLSGG
ncbi:MAG: ribonuclease HII [Kiloniellales bacterium]|nr:ribonuclease HII [Kiloniellales bacterium]